jgi:hypothetical protein
MKKEINKEELDNLLENYGNAVYDDGEAADDVNTADEAKEAIYKFLLDNGVLLK